MLRLLVAMIGCGSTIAMVAACSEQSPRQEPAGSRSSSSATTSASPARSPSAPAARPVTIAFAGDIHFESFLADRLDRPESAIGPMQKVLSQADLAIVNLETAVTTRGEPESKEYVFRAPPEAFEALRDAGVDVVTMANNHALDYGPVSVPDAQEAATAADVPVIGIGMDADQAYRPWYVTVHGQRIAFIAATAVLDADLVSSWSAGPDHPGVATALDGDNDRLVAAVREARNHADAVIVDLHYGSDQQTCPTEIQRNLVADLSAAGADVIIGQHAHVLLGAGYAGNTYVDYGLGNFEFYVSSGLQGDTGVLRVTIANGHPTNPTWAPARITDGVPVPGKGSAADEAIERWNALRGCTGLSRSPETSSDQSR